LWRHFFITGSLQANMNLGWVQETSKSSSEDRFSFTPNFYYRAVAGYNSRSWNVNVSWVSNRMSIRGASSTDGYIGRVGIVRATLAKQFQPGPKAKKILKPLDKTATKK